MHGVVDEFHGAPNKNNGANFLMVWRGRNEDDSRKHLSQQVYWRKLVDMSLISFAKVVETIERSYTLADYRFHPGILQRIADFRVKVGMGLHKGWAIEGAIGMIKHSQKLLKSSAILNVLIL